MLIYPTSLPYHFLSSLPFPSPPPSSPSPSPSHSATPKMHLHLHSYPTSNIYTHRTLPRHPQTLHTRPGPLPNSCIKPIRGQRLPLRRGSSTILSRLASALPPPFLPWYPRGRSYAMLLGSTFGTAMHCQSGKIRVSQKFGPFLGYLQ